MDTSNNLIDQAERLYFIIDRLGPINGSRLYRLRELAYMRLERRWLKNELLRPCGDISEHITAGYHR